VTFNLTIPQISGTPLDLTISAGQTMFVLGPNGSGKSSLMHKFYSMNHGMARRISAHRQNWFESNFITLSPKQKNDFDRDIKNVDNDGRARWTDSYSSQRPNIAIYNLVDAQNRRARSITDAIDQKNLDLAQERAKSDGPIKIINELLQLSNIPISISVKDDEVVASKREGKYYSVSELSDGERNALLIAANVLTAPERTLILIDEPERHLHRSIISPLLTLLFARKQDCAFVVSTHDVMLPLDNPTARALLVRECTYVGSGVTAWEADLIATEIDEELKTDILGARRKLLFVEGTENSLDKPLYSLIFPGVSVIAKSSCHDVEHAVAGIRDAKDFHWLCVWGIVDNDRRTENDIKEMKDKAVYATPVFSVESIYYHPKIQEMVAARYATVICVDASTITRMARDAALAAIKPHIQRLSKRAVDKMLRDEMFKHLPRKKQIIAAEPINVTIDVPTIMNKELARLQAYLDAGDLESIIEKYPVRETPALNEIAVKLEFQGRRQYENAVRKLLMDDGGALEFVKSLFGTLVDDIEGLP
jgi:ABC-type cobalamin/Fe3+-siderophores transport system ATPase subunit